jgi:hypothetical protein
MKTGLVGISTGVLRHLNLYIYCLSFVIFLSSAHVMLKLSRQDKDRWIGENMILLQQVLAKYPL